MTASANGHDDDITRIEDSYKYPKQKRETQFPFLARIINSSSVISTLLRNGADPNLANKYGWTPLMTASANGHHDVTQIFETFKKSK